MKGGCLTAIFLRSLPCARPCPVWENSIWRGSGLIPVVAYRLRLCPATILLKEYILTLVHEQIAEGIFDNIYRTG